MARLTVIYWRDIPAQVVAKEGSATAKAVLHQRFQVGIDRAAKKAGRSAMGDYLAEWRRVERPCGPDLAAEVDAEVARLDAAFPRERLAAVVAAGGVEEQA